MNVPADLKYSKSHEWVKIDGETAIIGITDYAQEQLGDIVFIELPASSKKVDVNTEFGSIESVKSVSELVSPLTGDVMATNDDLVKHPETVNTSPYDKAWMIKVKFTSPAELDALLTAEAYKSFITEEV